MSRRLLGALSAAMIEKLLELPSNEDAVGGTQ